MKQDYLHLILLLERLHRRFLDVVKHELEVLGVEDINNIQTLILYNIGEAQITVGELTARGYYLGSNVSYNIKKLVENDFLIQERSAHDRRSIKVSLSEKGMGLYNKIDKVFARHAKELGGGEVDKAQLQSMVKNLRVLEDYWSSAVQPHTFF